VLVLLLARAPAAIYTFPYTTLFRSNRKARPIRYANENAAANTRFASRNMAVLGTLILIFIALHMTHFWAKMHFSEMPLQQQEMRSEEHTSELQSREKLVCRLLLEKK